ncbi:MAG: hypothetical protein OIN86_08035 [Candidatus Methanoperedens sp.]|nr:hypothetical protein [Candidatus Methanoperedens sp.]
MHSINPDDEASVITTHNFMLEGEYISKLDENEILLGKESWPVWRECILPAMALGRKKDGKLAGQGT